VLALTDADLDQPAHHVVDPLVEVPRRVGAVLEQKEDPVRGPAPTFLDKQPE
jgi:hypothetical protein